MEKIIRKKKGFTLIELLVVIAIIGILASIVLVSLNKARSKARDTRRQADLRQVAVAVEMYYDDENEYPGPDITTVASSLSTGGYLTTFPTDPQGGNYEWKNNGADGSATRQKFVICADLENADIFYIRESGSGEAASCPDL